MLQKKVEEGHNLCLILINPDVLSDKNCLFYPYNAATKSYQYIDESELQGSSALEKMFADQVSYQRANDINPCSIYRDRYLDDCETTSEQAEVQCLDIIEPEYLLYIFEKDIPIEYQEIKKSFQQQKHKTATQSGSR